MTNEEFEKRKELILKQRAQFTAGMQQLREARHKLNVSWPRFEELGLDS